MAPNETFAERRERLLSEQREHLLAEIEHLQAERDNIVLAASTIRTLATNFRQLGWGEYDFIDILDDAIAELSDEACYIGVMIAYLRLTIPRPQILYHPSLYQLPLYQQPLYRQHSPVNWGHLSTTSAIQVVNRLYEPESIVHRLQNVDHERQTWAYESTGSDSAWEPEPDPFDLGQQQDPVDDSDQGQPHGWYYDQDDDEDNQNDQPDSSPRTDPRDGWGYEQELDGVESADEEMWQLEDRMLENDKRRIRTVGR
ncbi:hypothetical protein VTJ04DRAFT_5601 [Mycothermus thermophilus]|uniref:uncharacterized protein n=1 Tax=Humicola insolens TaxID=85995 RepID=UPI0037441D83